MSKSKSLEDFRSKHDQKVIIPAKFRAALDAMLKEGAENWDYEFDFIKRAGLSAHQLALFREQFAEHVVAVPGGKGQRARNVIFASAKVAAKARETTE